MKKIRDVYYVTPDGCVVPCDIMRLKKDDGVEVIVPQVKGGYQYLKTFGFETIYQYRKEKKNEQK